MKAVLILLILTVASSYGLECYDCVFHRGFPPDLFPPSDDNCQNNPKTVVTCTFENLSSRMRNATSNSKGDGKAVVFACIKIVGGSSSSSMSVVERGCVLADENMIGQCSTAEAIIGGEPITLEGCTCAEEKCNGEGDDTSGQSVVFGAGFMIISAFALFAAIVFK